MNNPDADRTWPMEAAYPADLYAGTARYYARYRVPYPQPLIEDLLDRLDRTPNQMLDLACGTGQVALALAPYVREVLAVDQEPDMIEVAMAEADRLGAVNVLWQVGRAEEVTALTDSFDLITVGSAFHRLDRSLVAEQARDWLTAGGGFALLHANSFWQGAEPWHALVVETVARWIEPEPACPVAGEGAGGPWRSHQDILRSAGFDVEEYAFPTPHTWRLEEIIGYLYSTSVASRSVLGERVDDFEADLRRALLDHEPKGEYTETLRFAYTLAR